jgi:hypothetical protein
VDDHKSFAGPSWPITTGRALPGPSRGIYRDSRLETDHLVRVEIDDGLVVNRDLTGLRRAPKLSDKLGTVDRLLAHGGGEQDVTTLALALGLVQGGVGVLDEFGPALARPLQDHGPDARLLLDLGPSEGERLREHA